jgi:transposase
MPHHGAARRGDRALRGEHLEDDGLLSCMSLEDRIPRRYPVRKMRQLVDSVLANIDELFSEIYARGGRPSIPPERLVSASLLQVFYSIRSER